MVDGEDDVAGGKAEFVKAAGDEDEDGKGGDVEEDVASTRHAITDDARHQGEFDGKGDAPAVGGREVFFTRKGNGENEDDEGLADGGGDACADNAEFGNGAASPDEEGVKEDVEEIAREVGDHDEAREAAA